MYGVSFCWGCLLGFGIGGGYERGGVHTVVVGVDLIDEVFGKLEGEM